MRIDFQPLGMRVQARQGESLLAVAQDAGIMLQAVCGGSGTCGRCRIQVVEGDIPPADLKDRDYFSPQELVMGWRLACRVIPEGEMTVYIPPESLTASQRLQFEGETVEIGAEEPVVIPVEIRPDIDASRPGLPDDVLVKSTLEQAGAIPGKIRYVALKELSDAVRQNGHIRLALRQGEVLSVFKQGESLLGLAVDAGTTKLAAYILDLETGEALTRTTAMNPQIVYGEDVVSRIAYCMQHKDGRETLRSRLLDGLNGMIRGMCAEIGVSTENIIEAVIVGNTAVHHLLCGFPVKQLGMTPYVPAVGEALEIAVLEFGLEINKGGNIFLPENIGGYIGGDHTAMLLATEPHMRTGAVLALDIGTNTEVTLSVDGQMLSCSCASGPAFEGAHIRHGMRAAAGAVEGVIFKENRVLVSTIEGKPAIGLCGSGMLDAIAELKEAGIIERRGNFLQDAPGVSGEGAEKAFILVHAEESGNGRDIVINRKDINEIQLAKGAIRSGIDLLLKKMSLEAESLDRLVIAGAFGSYLNIESAVRIGLLPDLPAEKFRQVGNAAGAGARAMLLSQKKRREAGAIARTCEFVELNSQPDFKRVFMKNMYLDG